MISPTSSSSSLFCFCSRENSAPGRRAGCSFYHPAIDGPFRNTVILGGLGHRDAFFFHPTQDIGFYIGCNSMLFFHMTPG